ncbi:NADP(H)-dependent aldo-keto reductase [Thioalkalivibrio denitrificans]|uniref:Protein tas n=1 Tax=Thioalkalivibrio denitrificans TaxID=108003 RepID=A0A1V3NGC9_9GAMM|nr:NADP(H)-dependent aldo-keto reductase [Thioalkalivibrio denitrificans]OOG23983.1 NADP(H)-dependent aldo-keto reductase [Thioalkalivibrio denitrificans]
MEKRKLGNIDVSVICLGTMTWGEQNTEAEAHSQLDLALERGVNFIDTAELYAVPPRAETQGLTETFIGNWLKRTGRRDEVVLASKVSGPGEWVEYIRGGPRLDRAHMTEALEGSLRRLGTDYLDLYQIHWPARPTNFFGKLGYEHQQDPDATPIEETLEVLDGFVRQGRVRHVGISNETPWGTMEYLRLARERGWPRVVSIQNPYSLLNRSFEVGLAEMAIRERVGLLAYSPLGFGVLSGKYLDGAPPNARITLFPRFSRYSNEQGVAATRAYVELARAHELSPAQMALAFVNSRPFLTSTIIGATTLEQLEENIASADLTLSDEVLEAIENIHLRHPNPCP